MSCVQTVPLLNEWRLCSLRSPDPSPLSHSHDHCFMKSMSALPSTCINLTSSQLSTFGDFSLLCYSSGLLPCPPTVYALDRSQMVLWELQPEPGPAQLRTPHTPCRPTLQGVNGPKALQNLPLDFFPLRVSSPHWPRYCAPAHRHPPTGPVPHLEGSFPFIRGAYLTEGLLWSPCSASTATPSRPALIHLLTSQVPHFSPRFHLFSITIPPPPEHKLHKGQHPCFTATS